MAYQALATVFHSQALPPQGDWEVRAVQPRTGPKAFRVARRSDSLLAINHPISASWVSGIALISAGQYAIWRLMFEW